MFRQALTLMAAANLVAAPVGPADAGEAEPVPGGGGLELAVYEAGNPEGPPILFIHGFTQSHLSWQTQFASPLADEFRLVALDMRGHGASDKPSGAGHYTDSALWADDIAAVIRAKQLERPVLVGWSYGGYVLADYLRHHGGQALGGLVFVGATARMGTEEAESDLGEAFLQGIGGALSPDVRTNIESTRAFMDLLTARPMSKQALDFAFGSAMMVPPEVRGALFARTVDNTDVLAAAELPTLVIQGRDDRIVRPRASQYIAETVPGAELLVYDGAGHALFLEDPERFNRDLAEFVRFSHETAAN